MRFRQGDILLVPHPFTNLQAVKKRPVLVISRENSRDLITCGITSNLSRQKNTIRITDRNLSHGHLPKESVICIDKIFTLEKAIVERRFGRVSHRTLEQAKRSFCALV